MNAATKITLELDFDEFNTLDVLITAEDMHQAAPVQVRNETYSRYLTRVSRLRERIAAARPPKYQEAIAAAHAARESVCD